MDQATYNRRRDLIAYRAHGCLEALADLSASGTSDVWIVAELIKKAREYAKEVEALNAEREKELV